MGSNTFRHYINFVGLRTAVTRSTAPLFGQFYLDEVTWKVQPLFSKLNNKYLIFFSFMLAFPFWLEKAAIATAFIAKLTRFFSLRFKVVLS